MNDLAPGQRPDELETLLRQAMRDDVADVRVSGDGLARIRERTDARRTPWWRSTGLAVAAGATVAAAVTGVYALSGGGPTAQTTTAPAGRPVVTAPPTAASGPSAPSAPGDPSAPPSADASKAPPVPSAHPGVPKPTLVVPPPPVEAQRPTTSALPVYYVAGQPTGDRLFREFSSRTYSGSAGRAALELMIEGRPSDSDYRSLWSPETKINAYTPGADGVVLVDVSELPAGDLAVHQLVYTVTAAEKDVQAVRLSVNGSDRGVHRRVPRIDVEGLVWVLEPAQGATVGSPVTFRGVASVFEATLLWRVLRDGEVVDSGFTTAAGAGPLRADWSLTLELDPGTYEFVAYAEDAEGSGGDVAQDTKTFTVR